MESYSCGRSVSDKLTSLRSGLLDDMQTSISLDAQFFSSDFARLLQYDALGCTYFCHMYLFCLRSLTYQFKKLEGGAKLS